MVKLIVGVNDLATTHPEFAKQWHPTKNGDLKPTDVTAGSKKEVWWIYPYDDPITGKHFDFEWEDSIKVRTKKGCSCPYLEEKYARAWQGFNDLTTTHPELAKQWHPTKNGDLKPTDVIAGSARKVWWIYPYDDPKTGKHFDFEWKGVINDRTRKGCSCPYLAKGNTKVWQGFNDLATTHPELAKQWHPTKNGDLKPTDVIAGSARKVWWIYPYDDPKTGKHYKFTWEAVISNRALKGRGCPYLNLSKLELLTHRIMRELKVNFQIEHIFENCVAIRELRFDVCFAQEKKIIELDGIQHFEPVDYFGGKEVFKDTQKRDRIKDDFCTENNISLLRIPYIYDSEKDKKKITMIIKNFVKYGTIPNEIKQFYTLKGKTSYIKHIESISQ